MISFLRTNVRWIGGGFLLTFFSFFGQTFFIGLSGAELREKFDLSEGAFGSTYMIATLASALTLPLIGRMVDHMSGRRAAQIIIPSLAAACLLLAYAPHVLLLTLALYMLRLFGQGMMIHIALTETGRWFAANRGRATSLVVPGVDTAAALVPMLFVILSAAIGWQTAWVGAALVLIFVTLPAISFLWAVPRTPQSDAESAAPAQTARDWTLGEVVRNPAFYILLACVLAPPFIGTSIFFHQDYLIELRGYDQLAFAGSYPLMAGMTVICALICGQLVDRFSASRILPFFLLPLCLASAVISQIEQVWGVYVFMFLMGMSNGFSATLLGALWPEIFGVKHLGAIRSVIMSAMVLSTALGPGLTGALIDLGTSLPSQLLWMSGWCLLACLVLGMISPRLAPPGD